MSSSRTFLWSSALVVSLSFAASSVVGCSDDDTVLPGDNDAGSSSSSSSGSSSGGDAGTPIPIPDGATLVWTSKGGFQGPTGDASTCQPSDDFYSYDLPSKTLSWNLCRPLVAVPEESPAYAYQQGTAVLSDAQDTAVHTALDGVVPNAVVGCGADKPEVQLVVTAPNDAETTYVDQFYHCTDDGKNYVDGLDAVGSAFGAAIPQ